MAKVNSSTRSLTAPLPCFLVARIGILLLEVVARRSALGSNAMHS